MMKHMKLKMAVLGLTVLPTLFYGTNLAFAKHHSPIPGVDIPYNAGAYYSMTAISWADSAPSKYALRDLAGQGGNVIDLTRLIKSLLFGDKFGDIVSVQTDETSAVQQDVLPYQPGGFLGPQNDVEVLNSVLKKQKDILSDVSLDEFSVTTSNYDAVRPQVDDSVKLQRMNKNYQDIYQLAQEVMHSQDSIQQAAQDATVMNANAQGRVQAHQAGNTLQTINDSVLSQKTALLNGLVMNYATEHMKELDDEASAREFNESMMFHPRDPYDERQQKTFDDIGYEKYETKGMPDFE